MTHVIPVWSIECLFRRRWRRQKRQCAVSMGQRWEPAGGRRPAEL